MQIQTSPLILSFGVFDPVGAVGIQADLAIFSTLDGHGLSVCTALLISDTTGVDELQPVEPEWVSDQARVLLEDMTVMAIKIGALGGVEQVSAIAEIISDYPDVVVLLDPFVSCLPEQGMDGEDMLTAVRQLLVPQATVLLLSPDELDRLAETWREPSPEDSTDADIAFLIELGCKYVVLTNSRDQSGVKGQRADILYGADGVLLHSPYKRLGGNFAGAGSTLSAALTAYLAQEALADSTIAAALLETPGDIDQSLDLSGGASPERLCRALTRAQSYTGAALAHAHRVGMGRWVPNHRPPRRAT